MLDNHFLCWSLQYWFVASIAKSFVGKTTHYWFFELLSISILSDLVACSFYLHVSNKPKTCSCLYDCFVFAPLKYSFSFLRSWDLMFGTMNKVWRSIALTPLGVSDIFMELILMASKDQYGVGNGRKNKRGGEKESSHYIIHSFFCIYFGSFVTMNIKRHCF